MTTTTLLTPPRRRALEVLAATHPRPARVSGGWLARRRGPGPGDGLSLVGSINSGCSLAFGYELRRHRLFESNIPLAQPTCRHRLAVVGFYGDHARTRQRTIGGHRDRGADIVGLDKKMPLVRDLLGIDWMTWQEAVLAISPAYTEHIGRHLLAALEAAA